MSSVKRVQTYVNDRILQSTLMYLVKTPPLVRTLFPDYVWQMPTDEKVVHLTFDDGPIPELTPWVLDVLHAYGCTATFFCVGENIQRNPDLYRRILQEGHATGNHTFHHLNGWHTETSEYLENVALCDDLMESTLFRPPYGKLKPFQAQALKKEKTLVFWDVLSGDFDERISPEQCLENVMQNYEKGSVIVFHDNIKAKTKLEYVLPAFLRHLQEEGFTSRALEPVLEEIY
ncbi:MAG: polysaccharide deacetylase family protein [Saprospiraceae bacterium]|jgi:peptidoglycan/xylan/chitin deacetylase (PgdA/CDA1 family)|nr:polysaccharide deacetylase family protein [Saprospiraceae bacterium]